MGRLLRSLTVALAATALLGSAASAAPPDPHVGLFEGGGVRVELAAAGTTASGAQEYIGRIDIDGRRARAKASGAGKLSGLIGDGDGAVLFTLEVSGDRATLRFSGKTVALMRGQVFGADAPPSPAHASRPAAKPAPAAPPDRVVVLGNPPLMRSQVEAHVDVTEWLLQLLLGDYQLALDAGQRGDLAAQLVKSYPRLSRQERLYFHGLPGMWAQIRALWAGLDAAGREDIATTYRARWLAAQQAATARMDAAQRAAHQHWVSTADAMRRGDVSAAERMAAERARLDAQWRRSLATAKARQGTRGSGPGGQWTRADTQRHMGRSMTNHFVYMNMQRMTQNSFSSGFATMNP